MTPMIPPISEFPQNSLLHSFHFAGLSRRLIVEPMQMQKPMNDVQLQLAHERIGSPVDATPSSRVFLPKCSGVAPRGLNTDKNFAVLKRQHISRPSLPEKFSMQKRHSSIGNKPDKDLARLAQVGSFPLSQVQTMLESVRCEPLELGNVHRNFSLNIPHADARGFCASSHLLRNLFFLSGPNQN